MLGQSISNRVLVYGWYHHQNIGDDLFIQAFVKLFPNLQFSFVNRITAADLADVSSVFFGGGSFVYDSINLESKELFDVLKKKSIFYIGIGVEGVVSEQHQELMRQAKLIAVRSANALEKIRTLNTNSIVVPDIVYSLYERSFSLKKSKSVLVMPNIIVTPTHADPAWKHASWIYFKSEFCQFLDELISKGYKVNFLSMCNNNSVNDQGAATEIINQMKNRKFNSILKLDSGESKYLIDVVHQYDLVITQRFHGIVLAQLARVPYISIHHHDKLKNPAIQEGSYISYYGLNKHELFTQFNCMQDRSLSEIPIVDMSVFNILIERVLAHF